MPAPFCTLPGDMTEIGERVRSRRESLDMTQTQLAALVGVRFQSIQAIERGGGSKYFHKIAKALGVTVEWLETGEEPMAGPGQAEKSNIRLIGPSPARVSSDTVPLRIVRGDSAGSLQLPDEIVDQVPRPLRLKGIEDAYCAEVSGNSMLPLFRPGAILHINPHQSPRRGDFVIVYRGAEDVMVKLFERRTADGYDLRSLNDTGLDNGFLFVPLAEVTKVHVVVGVDL